MTLAAHGAPRAGTPVLLLVGGPDDIGVMEREFAARYQVDYDLVLATSAYEAEEATARLMADDVPIAMFAVTPDLPDGSLEDTVSHLHRQCPTARRICIIVGERQAHDLARLRDAVAEGVVDAYLACPRGPRDEEFHTAVAEALSEWGWSVHGPETALLDVVANEATPELMRMKDVLSRMGVPFRKHLPDSEVGRAVIEEAGADAPLPLVRGPRGMVLVNPTVSEISEAIYGRAGDLPEGYVADLAVVGSGPAGLAAAVYGASEGLETVVVESEAVGGQAGTSSMIRNYLGFPRGISGMRLTQRARFQATRFGARLLVGRAVEGLEHSGADGIHVLCLAGGARVRARAVVVATGAQYRTLGVADVEELVGRGVHYGAAMSIAPGMRNAKVYVVGGGNSAGQAAIHLARFAPAVTMLVRQDGLSATMSDYLVREIGANRRITVRTCTEVVGGGGDARLQWLVLRGTETGREQRVRADALVLLLGADACTGWLPETIARDEKNFVLTGRDVPPRLWRDGMPPEPHATSVPGIYAVGDVRSGSMKRVASAAGEGASVVPAIHALLAERRLGSGSGVALVPERGSAETAGP